MPKNTSAGFINGILAFLFGFAMIWYIWWLAVLSAVAMLVVLILRAADDHTEYTVPATEVARIENQRFELMATAGS